MVDHREIAFEAAVEHSLVTAGGYEKGDPAQYDRARALHPRLVLDFVQATQPKSWQTISLAAPRVFYRKIDNFVTRPDLQHQRIIARAGFIVILAERLR